MTDMPQAAACHWDCVKVLVSWLVFFFNNIVLNYQPESVALISAHCRLQQWAQVYTGGHVWRCLPPVFDGIDHRRCFQFTDALVTVCSLVKTNENLESIPPQCWRLKMVFFFYLFEYWRDCDVEIDDWKLKSQQCHYHENELCSVLSVQPTTQDCLLPGHEYEEVRGSWALNGPFAPA